MATKGSVPPALFNISGLIPLTDTIFLWESIVTAVILVGVSVLVAELLVGAISGTCPDRRCLQRDLRPHQFGARRGDQTRRMAGYSPILTILVCLLLFAYLVNLFMTDPKSTLAALDLNTYNLIFISVGMLAALETQAFSPFSGAIYSRYGRSLNSVSVLCRDFRDDHGNRYFPLAGQYVRFHNHSGNVPAPGGILFDHTRIVHTVRRRQMGY